MVMERDITADIGERMAALQKTIDELKRNRADLDEQVRIAEQRLQALRIVFDWEAAARGKVVTGKASISGRNRWLGMTLGEAVQTLIAENHSWSFEKIRDRLIRDGFDFKGKRPGSAVNMALNRLKREQGGGDEAEG
jgi:hypothetical protein